MRYAGAAGEGNASLKEWLLAMKKEDKEVKEGRKEVRRETKECQTQEQTKKKRFNCECDGVEVCHSLKKKKVVGDTQKERSHTCTG